MKSRKGYTRNVARRKRTKRSSGNRNSAPPIKGQRGDKYSLAELFMAGIGALLIVLFLGIVITSILGD
jgi:Flp pilus assembly protein TadB